MHQDHYHQRLYYNPYPYQEPLGVNTSSYQIHQDNEPVRVNTYQESPHFYQEPPKTDIPSSYSYQEPFRGNTVAPSSTPPHFYQEPPKTDIPSSYSYQEPFRGNTVAPSSTPPHFYQEPPKTDIPSSYLYQEPFRGNTVAPSSTPPHFYQEPPKTDIPSSYLYQEPFRGNTVAPSSTHQESPKTSTVAPTPTTHQENQGLNPYQESSYSHQELSRVSASAPSTPVITRQNQQDPSYSASFPNTPTLMRQSYQNSLSIAPQNQIINKPISLEDQPSIIFNLLDSYSYRCGVEITSDIQDSICIEFYPNKVVIDEPSNNEKKTIKLVINTGDVLGYLYNVRSADGSLLPLYTVYLSASKLYASIKTDGKKEGLIFQIYVNPVNLTNSGIMILREKTFEAIEVIPTISGKPLKSPIHDYYKDVYSAREPNSRMSVTDFISVLKLFKNKRVITEFVNDKNNRITVQSQSGQIVVRLPSNPYAQMEEVSHPIKYEEKVLSDGWMNITISYIHVISLSTDTVSLLMKISKLGNQNVIKVYMDKGLPLVIVTKIGNYGECILSFSGDDDSNIY